HPDVHNVVDVYLVGTAAAKVAEHVEERRNVMTSSSCGLCGRVTIESLRSNVPPLSPGSRIAREVATSLPETLRARQAVFDETGGLHAAGLFTFDGLCR